MLYASTYLLLPAGVGEYQVVLAPPGNGRDTHRKWESLGVGAVILVWAGMPFNEALTGLPAVFVDDWAAASGPQKVVEAFLRMHGDSRTPVPAGCAALHVINELKARGATARAASFPVEQLDPPEVGWDFDRVYFPWWLFWIRCEGRH